MSNYAVTGDQLTAIADAIRLKTVSAAEMSVDDMPLNIELIPSGGNSPFELKGEYTLTESWENETYGVSSAIYDTLVQMFDCEWESKNDIILISVENNTSTSPYALVYILIFVNSTDNTKSNGMTVRRNSVRSSADTNTSAYVSQGATLKIYKATI